MQRGATSCYVSHGLSALLRKHRVRVGAEHCDRPVPPHTFVGQGLRRAGVRASGGFDVTWGYYVGEVSPVLSTPAPGKCFLDFLGAGCWLS